MKRTRYPIQEAVIRENWKQQLTELWSRVRLRVRITQKDVVPREVTRQMRLLTGSDRWVIVSLPYGDIIEVWRYRADAQRFYEENLPSWRGLQRRCGEEVVQMLPGRVRLINIGKTG